MKKIECSPYQLKAANQLNALSKHKIRHGALIKVEFPNIGIGYADCHPWTELGDDTLEEQLKKLSNGMLTPLTKKSLYFAKIDAELRNQNKNFFTNKILPTNHYTSTLMLSAKELEKMKKNGFQKIKLKCGINLAAEINYLQKILPVFQKLNLSLRMDCNCTLNFKQVSQLLEEISPYLSCLDFIEDPMPYYKNTWHKLAQKHDIKLAVDKSFNAQFLEDSAVSFFILKPAIQKKPFFQQNIHNKKFIFTSYMDHPVGQLCAMLDAITFYEQNNIKELPDCGLLTHSIYEENVYSKCLFVKETKLIPPAGTGFGFDELLKNEPWKSLENF